MKARRQAKDVSTQPTAKKAVARKKSAARPTTQTAEKPAVELSLHGWGIDLECKAIDQKAFRCLTVDGVTGGEEFDKYLSGGSGYSGALDEHCALYLGDVALRKTICFWPIKERHRVGGNAKYLLVQVSTLHGDIRTFDVNEFDKKLLTLHAWRLELSDGTSFDLVEIGYDSRTETYDRDISCKDIESFVLTRDGKRHPVIFNDE